MKGATKTRIRFLTSIASSEGWDHAAGDIAEVDSRQAAAFVKSGTAERTEAPVGRCTYGTCSECGSDLDANGSCWSVRCRGQWRASTTPGAA